MPGNKRKNLTPSLFSDSTEVALNGSKLALARFTEKKLVPSEVFESLSDILLESENLYPGIDLWFRDKVIPGLRNGRRVAYVLFYEGKAIAESIVKYSTHTKICSMRVDPQFQNKGLGPFLFNQIASELDNSIKTVHFTAPESLVDERAGLFDDLGFVFQGTSKKKYRQGIDELVFKGETALFKRNSVNLIAKKISKNFLGGSRKGILISVKPSHIEKILTGEKVIELRRKFSSDNKGCIALLYATQPIGKVLGDALIKDVIIEKPARVWRDFQGFLGCSKQEFDDYTKGADTISALLLDQVSKYPHPFEWDQVMQTFTDISRPPQSFQFIPSPSLSFWGSLAFSSNKEKKENTVKQFSLGF
ncbi:MAG: GNAT family N-acetyltransferase [Bacteroidota bacterium]